jgi:serine/threonine-protein kinase
VSLQDGDTVKAGDTVLTVSVQFPASCAECGESLDVYLSSSKGKQRDVVVFCDRCWQERCRESKGVEARLEPKDLIRGTCGVCGKEVEVEGAARPVGEHVCAACQARMLKKKGLLQKLLHTTSQSGRPEGIPAIRDYELRKSIGKGRLGTVYVARGKADRRQVAMKVIFSSGFSDAALSSQLNRCLEEVRSLRHPNLVEVLDYGSASGLYYIVTEYSEFGNIKRLIERRRGKLGLTEALPLMQQALESLAFIHQRGFFHGDLKPQNLLLMGREGAWRACISDMKLLSSIEELGLAGTITSEDPDVLPFTPRELLTGSGVAGPTADVWSIAAIFYYMLTGRIPTERKRETDRLASLIEPSIMPTGQRSPDLMPELAQLIDDSLNLDPRQRPSDAQQMLERLRKVQVRVVHLTIAQ